jgi:hypothetical protein
MMYLIGRENAAIVVRRLWSFKQPLIQSGLVAMFYQDPSTLPRVLEIVHKVIFFTLSVAYFLYMVSCFLNCEALVGC